MDIVIRPLSTHAEYMACLDLQHDTWGGGESFREAVGPAMLMVPQKLGGVTAAAFDERDRMLGFVYGITGLKDGAAAHWSHMLAVSEYARDRDIGRRLKEYQRRVLLNDGVHTMYWTYDPLVARNAHINFMKLGVEADEYVEDIYGSNEDSTVDAVIGTDRFIVRWNLQGPRVRPAPEQPPRVEDAPLVNGAVTGNAILPNADVVSTDAPVVHIAVPGDIQTLKTKLPDQAVQWRHATRKAFQMYLARGYDILDFVGTPVTPHHFYRLHHD